MSIMAELQERWRDVDKPFILCDDRALKFADIHGLEDPSLEMVGSGDVVAIIGDYEPASINALLRSIDKNAIVVPLTRDTASHHERFFDVAGVDVVIADGHAERVRPGHHPDPLLDRLRNGACAGLVAFTSGTTGEPKAILHNMESFVARFRTRRPTFRTANFLMFDHVGGINTLMHTLFNVGEVVALTDRSVGGIMAALERHAVELLPATPTFLRMLLMSGLVPDGIPASLKVISYGTERMDKGTLQQLCDLLPDIDFRQTYGLSELGVFRVRSRARDSLWMQVGGEGVETRIVDDVLQIRAANRMVGYLNAESPFDAEGWCNTRDKVEQDGEWIQIVGRTSDVISVGGLKFLPSDIEAAVLQHPSVANAKAEGVENPITGQHVELLCELRPGAHLERRELKSFIAGKIPEHMVPHRIRFGEIAMNHRFKRK